MKNRKIGCKLLQKASSKLGRITVLTGARQTGKTTLVQELFSDYAYISLDDPVTRADYAQLSAAQWQAQYPRVILDEVQKLPQLIDSVKATYDRYPETRFILLGSSQILLMEQVRESLAGRASLVEIYPLTLPERVTQSWSDEVKPSRMVQILLKKDSSAILQGVPRGDDGYATADQAFTAYLESGGMPVMVDQELMADEKREWLRDYIRTYLQRDLRDLANLKELEPFVRAQKSVAHLTGQLLNYSHIAKQSGISVPTAKRFVSYLEISYQVVILPPWFRNQNKRLAKSPKIHFLDPAIQRSIIGRSGALTGHEFESAVVAEIYKQIKSESIRAEFYHLRTLDGREVDLLIEIEEGYFAIEIKSSAVVSKTDARHLHLLEEILDKPLLAAMLISNDPQLHQWGAVTAVPAAWLL